MMAMSGRCRFPAITLPARRFCPSGVPKPMIALGFWDGGSREKIFTRVFPVRQGTGEAGSPRSAQCRGDVAAVDRGHVGGGLERQCLVQKGLGNVVRGYLAAEKIACHVVLFGHTARLGA